MRKWTWNEFETLLKNPTLSDQDIANLIQRSPGAVGAVREAVHSYHKGTKFWQTGLNKDIKQRLSVKQNVYICSVCGVKF